MKPKQTISEQPFETTVEHNRNNKMKRPRKQENLIVDSILGIFSLGKVLKYICTIRSCVIRSEQTGQIEPRKVQETIEILG